MDSSKSILSLYTTHHYDRLFFSIRHNLSYLSSENGLNGEYPAIVEMEATISKLEYTLKDTDVESDPILTHLIKQVVDSLRAKMAIKRIRWAEQERNDGECQCGTCPRYT